MRDFDEKRRIVEHLRPIDDAFFEKLMEDREVCEEILRVILEDPGLTIVEVIPQGSIRNLQGRSVRLDALCRRSGVVRAAALGALAFGLCFALLCAMMRCVQRSQRRRERELEDEI